MANGTLLEKLFIKIQVDYDDKGIKDADKDVNKLEDGVKSLSRALNVMTAALTGAAAAGLHAFTGWDRQMSTLAIKAGVMRREFDNMYAAKSRAIGREIGVDPLLAAEGYQKMHSLGYTGAGADDLNRAAQILQRERIANSTQAIDTSVALSNQMGGSVSPLQVLEYMMKAGQINPGDTVDYFGAGKALGPLAGATDVGFDETMAGYGILAGSAKTGREAETQMRNVLAFAMKKPTADAEKLLARTGKSFADIQRMIANDFGEFLDFTAKNFQKNELRLLMGTDEGTLGLISLINERDTFKTRRDQIRNNSGGVINDVESDSGRDFSSLLDKLNTAFRDFVRQYGKPFATMLRPLIIAATGLLNGIIALNDSTDGLLLWVPALVTAILGLRLAVIASTRAYGVARNIWSGMGGVFGGGLDADGRDGRGRRRSSVWEIVQGIGTAIVAGIAGVWGAIKIGFHKVVAGAAIALGGFLKRIFIVNFNLALLGMALKTIVRGRAGIFAWKVAIGALTGAIGVLVPYLLGFAAIIGGILAIIGYRSKTGQEFLAKHEVVKRDKLNNLAAENDAAWEQVAYEWNKLITGLKEWVTDFAIGVMDFFGISDEAQKAVLEFLANVADFFINFDDYLEAGWQKLKIGIAEGINNMLDSITGGEFDGRSMMLDIQKEMAAAGLDLYRAADGVGMVDKHGNLIFTDPKKFMDAGGANAANALTGSALTIHNENEWTLHLEMPDGSIRTFEAIDVESSVEGDYTEGAADAINRASQTFQIGG